MRRGGDGDGRRHCLSARPLVSQDRGLAVGSEPDRIETLYRSVIRLCAALDLQVIAEGIESTAQADTVFAAGCRFAQGHLFGRAVPIADAIARVAASGTVSP